MAGVPGGSKDRRPPKGSARPAPEPAPGIADVVLTAREAAGISQRELARRIGISNVAVAALERGRDPQWSTLRQILDRLPGLTQAALLPGSAPVPPEASPAAWSTYRRLYGFDSDAIRSVLSISPNGERHALLEIRGIRPVEGSLDARDTRTALMRSVCLAPRPVVMTLAASETDQPGGMRRIQHEDVIHEYVFPAEWRDGLTYRRTVTLPPTAGSKGSDPQAVEGSAHEVTCPTRSLEFEVILPPGVRSASSGARVWLPAGSTDPEESTLARYHHPRGLRVETQDRGRRLHLRIARPLIGVGYALIWSPAKELSSPDADSGTARTDGAEIGDTFRQARSRAGLTLRATATRLGVTWAAVRDLERGAKGRASTLRAYLREFPELCPQDLLPGLSNEDPLTLAQLWDYYRDLFGISIDEIVKTVQIDARGWCRTTVATTGLRATTDGRASLKIRVGLQRAILADSPSAVESMRAKTLGTTVRTVEKRGGRAVHQFVFPRRRAAGSGIDYTRRFERRQIYLMHESAARRALGGDPPFIEGTSLTVLHPTRRLRLVVCFPRGYWPAELRFHAWPDVHVPDADAASEPNCLAEFEHVVDSSRPEGRVSLTVERPVVGLALAVSWVLP